MRLIDYGPLTLTLIASLVVAVVLLAIRVFVMQRVQQKRQRENRQETERLRSLVNAYRSLAGSFSPATDADRSQVEEALADIVLFGSIRQVELAAQCANAVVASLPADFQPLIQELRADLRTQLGLEPIPHHLIIPLSGPSRSSRAGRGDGEGGGRKGGDGAGTAGGGAGGGGGGAAAGAGGVGLGIVAADAGSRPDS
ncbi:MAG: preprotein translocase subunit YajC [Burkholderiales bacterium]|nr:preprotein translocase subunit YajC [Burkholderiales bacterium]